MKRNLLLSISILSILILLMSPKTFSSTKKSIPWQEPENIAPKQWIVLGTFPNTTTSQETPTGLDTDFLVSIGGEAKVQLANSTELTYAGKLVKAYPATLNAANTLDFIPFFKGESDHKVVYAYAEWNVKKAGNLQAIFGSDDGAKVWLNGTLIHNTGQIGRSLDPNADQFILPLVAGKNRLMVKVENGTGDWCFALRIFDEQGKKQFQALDSRKHLDLLDPGPEKGAFLLGESFPNIIWRNSNLANLVFGNSPIIVRWYNQDLNEVTRPEKTGRYAADIECKTLDGYLYKRMLAFVKLPQGFIPDVFPPPFGEYPEFTIPDSPLNAIAKTDTQKAELSRYIWRALAEYTGQNEIAAISFAALAEETAAAPGNSDPNWLNSGFIKSAEFQLALRMKLEGRNPRAIVPVKVLNNPVPELRTGTEQEANMKSGTTEKLRALCKEWIQDDPNGFVVVVVRNGVIFMHDSYGDFKPDTPFYPASIGKSIAGLTFARAVDQGLVNFDEPVGEVLMDWRGAPDSKVTFRWCFNHLTGLSGHASHGGLFNAYLDNSLYIQDAIFETPGLKHRYNGDGYNLAGKALELTTGKSIWRLLYENMEKPFDEPVRQVDLGFGGGFTGLYLAKVGQMILQDGNYGKYQFYTPGFIKSLYPKRVADFAPDLNDKNLEWGIGLTWMPDAAESREKGVLGPNVIGHGSASNSAWRVDPDHNLVIVIGRNAFKDWNATNHWVAKFATIVAEGLD
ncbi:MAG: serine hydrolase domain-containing protein [bacterium]